MRADNNREHVSLTPEQLEAFRAEVDAIRDRIVRELGEEDARYIHELVALQRRCEIAGRALLFAGVLPPAWLGGVALLALSKVLDNMEIGHNVLHGQYDWMNDPELHSTRYEWDWMCPADHWRHSHNYIHHTFTNIVGQDRDIGYGLLRMADEQPWNPARLGQPIYAFWQMVLFEWAVAVHDLELDNVLKGRKSLRQTLREYKKVVRKGSRQVLKDFVLFPALSGPFAPVVASGNLTANLTRNIWAHLVIFCGHFPDGVEMYRPEDVENETRAEWYVRQIQGSANIEGSRLFHILSGNLSHQIEHHIFPDLPSSRYPEIAPEIRALCAKYGIPYNTARFSRQVATAVSRIVRCALPTRPARDTRRSEEPGPAPREPQARAAAA